MAKRGRKKTPQTTLKLRGSWRAKDAGKGPHLAAKTPAAPSWLTADAKREWDYIVTRLADSKILTELDRTALGLYCQAVGDFVTIRRQLNKLKVKQRYVTTTSNSNQIQQPLIGAYNRAWTNALKAASEFGLTPCSRAGLPDNSQADGDDARRFFNAAG